MAYDDKPLDGLYTSVQNLLASLTEGLHSGESTTLAIRTVLSTVHRATADFAEGWNARKPAGLQALPTELQVDCLSQLSLLDRIRASHVSRSWRHIVVHSHVLWNSVPPRHMFLDSAGLFEIMVTRSGGAPLDVQFLPLAPEPHASLTDEAACAMRRIRIHLAASMPRMRSLNIGLSGASVNDPILWNSPAPWLESLTVQHPYVIQLDASWLQYCVPNLRSLTLEAFELPSSFVSANSIECFSGGLVAGPDPISSDARALFKVFPRLVSLTLTSILNIWLLPHSKPPDTLRHVTLSASMVHDVTGNLPALLRHWSVAKALKSLAIDGFKRLTVDEAVGFFVSIEMGFWELTTSAWPMRLILRSTSSDGFVLTVSQRETIPVAAHGPSDFSMLRSLTLDGYWITEFLAAGAYLPGLSHLTILDAGYYNTASYQLLQSQGFQPMRVPVLESARFAGMLSAQSVLMKTELAGLPDFLEYALDYDAEMLDVLTVTCASVVDEVRALLSLAFEVRCLGPKGETWTLRLDELGCDSNGAAESDDEGYGLLEPIL